MIKRWTVFTNKMHFSPAPEAKSYFYFDPLSLWLFFILSQTLSLGRTLCWVVIFYLILLLMETSLFLLSLPPPPAPLLLLALALEPVWRSSRLVSELLVRRPPTLQQPSVSPVSAGCLGPWNHSRLQMHPKPGGPIQTGKTKKCLVLKGNYRHSVTASQTLDSFLEEPIAT